MKIDPPSPSAHFLLADTFISAGRYNEAAGQCEKLPADFTFTGDCLGRARLWQGRTADAIRALKTASDWGYLAKTARSSNWSGGPVLDPCESVSR